MTSSELTDKIAGIIQAVDQKNSADVYRACARIAALYAEFLGVTTK